MVISTDSYCDARIREYWISRDSPFH